MGGLVSHTNQTLNLEVTPDRWCTTPFFTRTRRMEVIDQVMFMCADLLVLIFNLIFCFSVLKIMKLSIERLNNKPCMWLIFHLTINDIIFTSISQVMYGAKLILPNLKCSFDLVAMFLSQALSHSSIALIVQISFMRYLSTKHLLSMRLILTLRRAKFMLAGAFLYGISVSSTLLIGSIVDNVVIINLPPCLTDIIVPIIIPIIYSRALKVARSRRSTVYDKGRLAYTDTILKQVAIYTLVTYVPFRLCFFGASTFKMMYTIELENNSTHLLQIFHSLSFLILCMTPIGNSILYIVSDRRARNIVYRWKRDWKRMLSSIRIFKLRRPSVANAL